jgi:hypothetical protein
MLGRSTELDGIEELSWISASAMSVFFHEWCAQCRNRLYPTVVKFPESDEEIKEVMSVFALVGFPGCLGSMDVVHVHWGRCPESQRVLHTGKEGYPTIAYQVIVDHLGRAMACTAGFYGSCNDKTIVKFDGQIRKLRLGSHSHVKYVMFNSEGQPVDWNNVWIMVDGGYLKWEVTISADGTNCDPVYVAWRKKLESVRKDVECFFGRLKKRFRILKGAIQVGSKEKVDNIFFTCVALQNKLHDLDRHKFQGQIRGDDEAYWDVPQRNDFRRVCDRLSFQGPRLYTDSDGDAFHRLAAMGNDEATRYQKLEAALVAHFGWLVRTGQHKHWMRSNSTYRG